MATSINHFHLAHNLLDNKALKNERLTFSINNLFTIKSDICSQTPKVYQSPKKNLGRCYKGRNIYFLSINEEAELTVGF